MQVNNWLHNSQGQLHTAAITTARLDCLVLLEDVTRKDRGWLLAHPDYNLSASELKILETHIDKRIHHVPLAYIRGKVEFYGRSFRVNEHTLVPRPETETILSMLKDLNIMPGTSISDIGTGSGCIAISAALELPNAYIRGYDVDSNCLLIAEQNADALHASVQFYESDLLLRVSPCDVLVCNLPYVPDNFPINTAASYEPTHAIFGGSDGLEFYRSLFQQIIQSAWKPIHIVCESLPSQHERLTKIAQAAGYSLEKTDDFIQLFTAHS